MDHKFNIDGILSALMKKAHDYQRLAFYYTTGDWDKIHGDSDLVELLFDAIVAVDPPHQRTQSAGPDDVTKDTSVETEQNVEFNDEPEEQDLIIAPPVSDSSYSQGFQASGSLASFLSRPVEIHQTTWEVGAVSPFLQVFNPWELYLSNPRVLNKLDTFKLLRGTLQVKIVVNGAPFHYGRVFVGTRPTRYDNNPTTVDMVATRTSVHFYDVSIPGLKPSRPALALYTARPHVFVDPSTNQPMQLSLPFFCATNWLDLQDPETINRMGRLETFELNQLRHANGATDPVTITYFAWMENVALTGLTQSAPMVTQDSLPMKAKKKGKDEYSSSSPISSTASVVALAAGHLATVPIIGKFARATQIGAGAMADIARIFGFSRPSLIGDPIIQRPTTNTSISFVVGGDGTNKLTLDPKQELSVSPDTTGLDNEDQMSFAFIKKREVWIDKFNWTTATFPDRGLYTILVHPRVMPTDVGGSDTRYWQTPMSHITEAFQYWTGGIKYRFQIVASQYHRGRLLIQYDPNQGTVNPDLVSNYSRVIDITECRDFTVEVQWSQPQPYGVTDLSTDRWAVSGYPGIVNTNVGCNGVLRVFVLNELAAPLDTASVEINVYVSAADNFEVAGPTNRITGLLYTDNGVPIGPPMTTQSWITSNENDFQQESTIINGNDSMPHTDKDGVFFGEKIISLRALLKRYNYHTVYRSVAASVGIHNVIVREKNMPNTPGPRFGGNGRVEGSGTFISCYQTYLKFYVQSYAAWRGSIRRKIYMIGAQGSNCIVTVARSGENLDNSTTTQLQLTGAGVPILQTIVYNPTGAVGHSMGGAVINHAVVNGCVEYELPFYSPYRYVETNEPYNSSSAESKRYNSGFVGGYHYMTVTQQNLTANAGDNMLDCYVAAGEDLSYFYFIGCAPYIVSSGV